MKASAITRLSFRRHSGLWYRAVPLQHYQSLLGFTHTATIVSRFNPADVGASVPVLYFTENHQVALLEAQALVGSPYPGGMFYPNPAASWAIIVTRVRLKHVVDLTRASQRRLISTTVQELTGDWIGYRLRQRASPAGVRPVRAPTQQLGAALAAHPQAEGLLTYSAHDARHRNLVVFPHQLQPGSWIRLSNPITGKSDRIGP